LTAAAILVTFLGLAGFALDRAFISSAEVSLKNQLRTQTFAMLSVLEVEAGGGILLPDLLPEARLMVANSGLYGFIISKSGDLVWQSGSSIGIEVPPLSREARGSEVFLRQGSSLSSPFRYSFSFAWETEDGVEHEFTLVMVEASDHFEQLVSEHRNKIILWLGLVGAFLLLALTLALRWSLAPLARVRQEIDQIERGRQDGIAGTYPQEIAQLSERINLFIRNERNNLERYRNTLGDLAHSLKTPLAVIRGMSESGHAVPIEELAQYVDRMGNIVDYQLKRAASTRISLVHSLVEVGPLLQRVIDSLKKVYADKDIQWQVDVSPDLHFYGEESDLLEVLGNVMDNACKWAGGRISVRASVQEGEAGANTGIRIVVEDDGPGISADDREAVLERGVRADEQVDGQGIGLAVCREIVCSYQGSLKIGDSDLGGAAIELEFSHPLAN
jgi:two-component system sensor histidine kinase PhoQ